MNGSTRRQFLAQSGSLLALGAAARRHRVRRDGAERQVRPRDQGRRRARSEPEPARQARHRHPLRRDRGGRGRHPGRARAARARRRRQAGDAGPRSTCMRTSIRTARRSASRPTSWCRFQGTTTVVSAGDAGANNFAAFRRFIVAADAHAPLRLRAHRQHRPHAASRWPSSTTSTSRRPTPRQGGRRERRHRDRRQGAHVARTSSPSNGLEPLKRAIAGVRDARAAAPR